jgi:hypothetical protein
MTEPIVAVNAGVGVNRFGVAEDEECVLRFESSEYATPWHSAAFDHFFFAHRVGVEVGFFG